MDILQTALSFHKAGISVVPVMADGSKRPAGGAWKQYQNSRATVEEIHAWFTENNNRGIGIVTGNISGNLEMLELEGRAATQLSNLKQLAENSGLGGLFTRILKGWFEQSPSGGWHFFYRVDDVIPGNTKLAADINKNVLAETRSEGGFVVTAPSAGTVHPTGKPYKLITGGPDTMPTITASEREALHALFATLHEHQPEPSPAPQLDGFLGSNTADDTGGLKPGEDYENKTDWADILTPTGWTLVFTRGRTRYWRRPGKADPGFSATTGHAEDRDRLYVFTTSTEFEAEHPYTKFGAYCVLHHGGDHSAAASQLRTDGYGEQKPKPTIEERTQPRTLTIATSQDPPATQGNLATVTDIKPKPLPQSVTLTDRGNSELLINHHGNRLRYAPSRGKWLQWDTTRWAWQEDDAAAIEASWETIAGIEATNDTERNHKHKSLSRRSLEAAVALARRDSRIRVTADQLDNEPFTLNTPTGLVNLTNGQLSPADPTRLHTKITTTPYDPDATAPRWQQFLDDTFEDQPDITQFFQRLAGYAATGQVTHHILPFLHGPGGGGKSVALDVLVAILGDYATTAPSGFLMAGRERHETEIARLSGMRLIVASEVNQNSKFDEAKMKLLTGGDKLTAHFMHQDHFTFIPTHTLFLMGNHQPKVEAGGESFWRRLRMLPFTKTVPEEKRIEGLAQTLIQEEGPGILNWIVQGAISITTEGLNAPAAVMAATDTYAAEEDAIARFMADHVNLGGGTHARVNTAHMRTTYAAWCRAQGENELSPQVFGRELRTRFDVQQVRSHGKRFYTNLTLLDADELDEEQQAEHWDDR